MITPMRKILILISMLLVLPLNAAPKDGAVFKDWVTRCVSADNQQQCHIEQNIVAGKEKKLRLMTVQIGYFEQRRIANFIAPLGVLLTPGVALEIDGFKFSNATPFNFCNTAGCSASAELDDKMISLMKKGKKLVATIIDPSGKTIAVPVSLSGFTPAFNNLSSN